ncbi:MICOS complex subunit mic60 [Batrachochytrium dendrobatidis]|nr:MICOS complex subunit mic60 [Batrachochytrium dendrobatidis]KAK5672917.1 MICOS complex subunit mic60 [Batrachochytrium dendrobatidis]
MVFASYHLRLAARSKAGLYFSGSSKNARLYSTVSSTGSGSFSPVKWLLSIGVVSTSVYFGAAYAATKNETIHKLWINNQVPGGEAALDLTRSFESRIRKINLSDIHQSVSDTTDMIKTNAEHAFDYTGRTIHQATEMTNATIETVSGYVDTVSNATSDTIKVATNVINETTDTIQSVVHDAEAVYSSVVSAVTGTTARQSESKADSSSSAKPSAVTAPAISNAEPQPAAKKPVAEKKMTETPAIVKTQTDDHPASPKTLKKQDLPSEKTIAAPVSAPTPVPAVVEKQTPVDDKTSKTVLETKIEKKPVVTKVKSKPEVKETPVEKVAVPQSPPLIETIDAEAGVKAIQNRLPVFESFMVTLDDLSKTVNHLLNEAEPLSGDATHLRKARKDLDALTKFVTHLEADEVAMVHTALSQQAVIFQRTIDAVRENSNNALSQKALELESELTSKLLDQEKNLTSAYEHNLAEQLIKQAEEFRAALDIDLQRQAAELEKFWSHEVKERVDQEREGRLSRLDHLALKVKYLERISLDAGEGFDRSHRIHQLQTALRAIRLAIDNPHTTNFSQELKALQALCEGDEFVSQIVSSLPKDAARQYTSYQELTNYLHNITTPLRRSQLVSDDTGALSYALSLFLSYFILPKHGRVAGTDLESILARTEHHLFNNRMDEATREINQLSGWPKRLSRDWLAKARTHLEIQQAIKLIEVHLNLQSMGVV